VTLRAVKESRDPESVPGIDWLGIILSASGLAGPVFALIEQPTHGWNDPLVFIPLAGGVVLFALFLLHEARAKHPMLELSLFRIRNFAFANLTTLAAYAGLIGAFFFIGLFLQQTAGYTPLEAGLATLPVSLLMFVLSPRFGKLASGTGPRLPMSAGPVVGGLGLLLFLRVGADPSYVADVLPAVLLFGLGLSATVAPLTATVLDSVDQRHTGIASGVNNGISRVAGLLSIAILGAVISASFSSHLDQQAPPQTLGSHARSVLDEARTKPLGAPPTGGLDGSEAQVVRVAVSDANVSAFHLAIAIEAALMIVGGLIAWLGIRNPEKPLPERDTSPHAAFAGECGRDLGDRVDVPAAVEGTPDPVSA
jgi:hypothetical protein